MYEIDGVATSERDLRFMFDDYLDDTYGRVMVGEVAWDTSALMQSVLPQKYEEQFQEWLRGEIENGAVSPARKTYRITTTELFEVVYFVDANSPEEARRVWETEQPNIYAWEPLGTRVGVPHIVEDC